MKARIAGPEKTSVARQWLGKHVSAVMNNRNDRGLVGSGVFYVVHVEAM
jgi:hypothetical protein